MSVIMYRGLTTNQQVGDRYGRSTTGIAASLASSNNVTSNGEYGGWFGQSSISYPALSRAKSETVWRTGGNTTAVNTASIQDIMQLLKQGQSPRPVMANVTRSGPNGLRLVGSRTNPSVQQGAPHPGSSTDPVAAPSQSSQGNQPEERFQQSGEHLATTNHLPSNGSAKRWPVGAAEIPNADRRNVPKVNGRQQPQQRGFNGHSPAAYQRLAGSLPSDQNRVMKSATTLGFASERSDAAPDEQNNNRNFASNFRTPGPNVPGNRNIYNAGSVPTWRNRWSQGHPLYRPGQPPARAGPMTTNEAIYRPEPAAHLSTSNGGPNVQGTVQFNTNNGHSASWQSAGSADDVGNAVLANRLREDRAHFHPDCRVNSKLETVTAVDFMPAAKQRPGAHANFSDENASKLGRYGLGPAFERNNSSYPLRLVPEGFRSDGSGMAQSNGSMYSHLDHENKLEKSHLAPGTSEETVARSPGHASVSTPRLGTNCAQGPASSPPLGTNLDRKNTPLNP